MRILVKVFPQAAFVTVLRIVMLFVPPRSLADGASNVQGLPHSTVLFAAQVITGAVVSTTVTVCEH
jgi:hypothetical protein